MSVLVMFMIVVFFLVVMVVVLQAKEGATTESESAFDAPVYICSR